MPQSPVEPDALLVLFLLIRPPFAHAEPRYLGTYAADCAKRNEGSVTILPDAIVLRTEAGARTLRPVEENLAFYGRLAPPGFVTAFLVDALPGKVLTLEVFESHNETTVALSGHPDVEKALTASLHKGRLRHCDGRR